MNYEFEKSMNKSNPSLFGKLTSTIFDEYPIYKCEISSEIINNYLPDKLPPFNSISLKNYTKREFFYSKPIIFASRSQLSDQFEELSYSIKLEDLLEDLLSKTNHIIRYNFVIIGNFLILVQIPHIRHFSYHILCKHITLANRSEDVRFAGEFWRDENKIFRFNNNSGTYRPSNLLIDKAVQIFNELTPRLQFQGISFQINSRPSFKYRFIFKIKNKRIK
jgi:hypothetical protein